MFWINFPPLGWNDYNTRKMRLNLLLPINYIDPLNCWDKWDGKKPRNWEIHQNSINEKIPLSKCIWIQLSICNIHRDNFRFFARNLLNAETSLTCDSNPITHYNTHSEPHWIKFVLVWWNNRAISIFTRFWVLSDTLFT